MARLGLQFDLLHRAHIEDYRYTSKLRRMQRLDMNDISDTEFMKLYRLDKPTACSLIDEITPYFPLSNIMCIPADTKILTVLSFLASGSYQTGVGRGPYHAMAQPTVSKSLRIVINALNQPQILRKYIRFPKTSEERNNLKKRFYEKFQIPDVIGCIDGTHVGLIKPSNNENVYLNKKHYHSLNTQIICDSDLNILHVDASHGGASPDSLIWQNHSVHTHMQKLHENNETVCLLGDSGYPLQKWLMTPITDAAPNTPEAFYSSLHETARNVVDRTIKALKSRWHCLLAQKVLHYDPNVAEKIVNACVVLHNIANQAKLPVPKLSKKDIYSNRQLQVANSQTDCVDSSNETQQEGKQVREKLIERLWNSRL